jgi:hypothetical protein
LSSPKPFELTRWDAPKVPTKELLVRMLERQGLTPAEKSYTAGTHTQELKQESGMVQVLIEGHIQFSFPGYGVVELHPGDQVDIDAGLTHDIKVLSHTDALLLEALR